MACASFLLDVSRIFPLARLPITSPDDTLPFPVSGKFIEDDKIFFKLTNFLGMSISWLRLRDAAVSLLCE